MIATKIPPKLLPWFEARKRYRLSDTQIHMARELGLNPEKFGSLANHHQEAWKLPLPQFIERCFEKQFKLVRPVAVLSLEEVIARELAKKQKKQAKKKLAANAKEINSDNATSES
jgi:hypothetical protein